MRWPGWPSLPLLGKELIEQSNRRRTFVIRAAYALLLYVTMLWGLAIEAGWSSDSLAMLGRGREFFETLVGFQFFAIYAFLPGLAAGVLTAEKERDTLAMLLLTKLGPWTIVWEKLLSRLMPLAMLLLLSLPLLAVAYSLGGVEFVMILDAVWVLAVTAFQVGALTVFCSAWFRTTAGAFVGTYVIGFLILFFPLILYAIVNFFVLLLGGQPGGNPYALWELTANFLGPAVFYEDLQTRMQLTFSANSGFWPLVSNCFLLLGHFIYLVARTSPLWITGCGFLIGARLALWPRAFIRPQQRILQFFRWMDGVFHQLNQNSVTKGVVLMRDSSALPTFQPIAWRETTKKSLGTTRYLVRFLLVVEPIVLLFLLLSEDGGSRFGNEVLPGDFPNSVLWIIMALAVTVLSTGLIAGERSRQTLEVLLSTPMPTREILRQKLSGVRKVIRVLSIPLLTVLEYEVWSRYSNLFSLRGDGVQYRDAAWLIVQGIAPLIVYPAIILWIGFHLGLRMRTQGQAMLATLGVIVVWCLLPALMHNGLEPMGQVLFGPTGWATFSPLIYTVESIRLSLFHQELTGHSFNWAFQTQGDHFEAEVRVFAFHFGSLLVIWLFLYWRGFTTFGRLLQRNDGSPETPP